MITTEHIETALGDKFDKGIDYRVVEKGTALASLLARGYSSPVKLDDTLSAGNTELFVLTPPVPPTPPVVVPRRLPRHVPPPEVVAAPPAPAPPKAVEKPKLSIRDRIKRDKKNKESRKR